MITMIIKDGNRKHEETFNSLEEARQDRDNKIEERFSNFGLYLSMLNAIAYIEDIDEEDIELFDDPRKFVYEDDRFFCNEDGRIEYVGHFEDDSISIDDYSIKIIEVEEDE